LLISFNGVIAGGMTRGIAAGTTNADSVPMDGIFTVLGSCLVTFAAAAIGTIEFSASTSFGIVTINSA
jgi:hypothetical protein